MAYRKTSFFHFIRPTTILAAIGIALVMFACLYFGLVLTRPGSTAALRATPQVQIISAPTSTRPFPTASPTPTPEPTDSVPEPPPPGDIAIDALVQITGTGGDGLRFRTEPGLNGQVIFLAIEAEVFRVSDGPREADGYTWWYLVGPYDPEKTGWAVSNYLQVIQNP